MDRARSSTASGLPFNAPFPPETSLHPDLLRPLAALIEKAATRTQVVVVTHSQTLRDCLRAAPLGSDQDA